MSDISKSMRRDLKDFNQQYQPTLNIAAQTLLARGVVRVHYGVDYVNDDGSPADYAVLEYSDGRTEEQGAWLEDLDYDTFALSVRYCHPYTFDTRSAEVSFDASGGQIDTEENVIRMYHTELRRAALEIEAEAANNLQEFSGTHYEALSDLCALLKEQGIDDLYFGVDGTLRGYELSDWLFADFEGEAAEQDGALEKTSPVFSRFRQVMSDFPEEIARTGTYSLNSEMYWVYSDHRGGTHVSKDGTVRAYFSEAQLEALKAT